MLIVDGTGNTDSKSHRQIMLTDKDDQMKFINQLSHSYDPLHYVLMFIHGEHGWSPNTFLISERRASSNNKKDENEPVEEEVLPKSRYVTAMQYYAYQIQQRPSKNIEIHYNKLN